MSVSISKVRKIQESKSSAQFEAVSEWESQIAFGDKSSLGITAKERGSASLTHQTRQTRRPWTLGASKSRGKATS